MYCSSHLMSALNLIGERIKGQLMKDGAEHVDSPSERIQRDFYIHPVPPVWCLNPLWTRVTAHAGLLLEGLDAKNCNLNMEPASCNERVPACRTVHYFPIGFILKSCSDCKSTAILLRSPPRHSGCLYSSRVFLAVLILSPQRFHCPDVFVSVLQPVPRSELDRWCWRSMVDTSRPNKSILCSGIRRRRLHVMAHRMMLLMSWHSESQHHNLKTKAAKRLFVTLPPSLWA